MSANLLVNHTDSHYQQIVLNLNCFTITSQQEKVNSKQFFYFAEVFLTNAELLGGRWWWERGVERELCLK